MEIEKMEMSACFYKILQRCDTDENGACFNGFAYMPLTAKEMFI